MTPPLLSPPSEVLIEILSYLHPRDIAACQRSCRQLNDTVSHSQLLRYLIRVGRAGLHDPLFPSYTICQRIEALEKWETAWSNLEMIETSSRVKHMVPWPCGISSPTLTYRIHDEFLIMTHNFDSPGYAYVDLRTFKPKMEKDPWTKITNDSWRHKIRDFAFSVEQDLALVIFSPPTYDMPSMFIELRAMSFLRGTPHPYVVSAAIPTESSREYVDSVIVVDDRTILNVFSRGSQRIFLHSWKDGHVYLLREASKEARSIHCTMLSRDTMALVDSERASTTLELCRIVEESDGGAPSLITLVRLGLPSLTQGTSVLTSSCIRECVPTYSDAPSLVIEGRPPRRVPFRNSTEEGLVAVTMHIRAGTASWSRYGGNEIYFMIVTHLRTLVALATIKSPGVTFIPWENWGPRVTACLECPINDCSDALMGERLTTISKNTKNRLTLFDFNSSRIRDTIERTGNSSGPSGRMTTVKHRSVIHRGSLFREDVVGELPFIPSVWLASSDWTRPVNYEEGLAVLSWDVRGRRFSPPLVAFRH